MKLSDLTGRSRQVADLIVKGYTVQEIAGMLGLSWKTVHSHRHRIFETLGINSDLQMLAMAVREARETMAGDLDALCIPRTEAWMVLSRIGFIDEVLP